MTAIACVDGGAIDLQQRFESLDECVIAMKPPYEQFVGILRTDEEKFLRRAHPDWPETGIQGALACHDVDEQGRIQVILTWDRHRQIVEAMWHQRVSQRWSSIKVPVLFVTASERMRPAVEAAIEALPDGRGVWFEGAHHDVHAQKPVEVADALLELLP